ncbi:MAG: hypothetical protein AAF202_11810 [Pseudomonadota bacterium]
MFKMKGLSLLLFVFVFLSAGCSTTGSRSPSSTKSYDCSAKEGKFMVDCR